MTPDDVAAAGPDIEPKFRICAVSWPSPDSLHIELAESRWSDGASFHRALRRLGDDAAGYRDGALSDLLASRGHLPGVASVHAIVITRDRMVLQSRRAADSAYAPGTWSASFEEQLTRADVVSTVDGVFETAARRGFREEFGLPGTGGRVRTLAVIVEPELLNQCVVVLFETAETAGEVRSAVHAGDEEIDGVRFVAADPAVPRTEADRADLHPSAAIRLYLLARALDRADP